MALGLMRAACSLIRACMHDPIVFEDADEFRPERFIRDGKLDVSARDPSAFAFGFGRRYVMVVVHIVVARRGY